MVKISTLGYHFKFGFFGRECHCCITKPANSCIKEQIYSLLQLACFIKQNLKKQIWPQGLKNVGGEFSQK